MTSESASKMSRAGIALCAMYVAAAACCVVLSMTAGDQKGQFVLLQLPVALQVIAVDALGLGALLVGLSWQAAYLIIGAPTIFVLYGLGKSISKLARWSGKGT